MQDNHFERNQPRGSSPPPGELRQVCSDWAIGLRSTKQTLDGGSSLPTMAIQQRLDLWMTGQRTMNRFTGRDSRFTPDSDDQLRWQDDGGESG